MDRDDARFVAQALDSRISGDRDSLDRLAATSADRLRTTAARVRSLAADWPPAIISAHELDQIAELGGGTLDQPRALVNLQKFVDKLIEIVISPAKPVARNRHERRVLAKAES